MTLFGFADLHAHPASHLAFGAETRPDNPNYGRGVFWGKPGMALANASSSIPTDLPECPPDKHAGFDEDPVRHNTRVQITSTLNHISGFPHKTGGWPHFQGWPHSQSILHQQMHVSWIHRAWQGGLRLMIASVTENETLAMLWHRSYGASRPAHNPNYDYNSARTQLTFIHQLVAANADWMEIVTSPTQARATIANNKLALVLSVEMDSLTIDHVKSLRSEFGVYHITPIHLIDNSFGGVAVYSDTFNTHNHFVNQQFYSVLGDSLLRFQLARPQYLKYLTNDPFGGGDLGKYGAMEPNYIGDGDYRALGYPANQGHRNVRSIERTQLVELMKEGFIIDLAHMSDASQTATIELCEQHQYPVMNSHTGLRPDNASSDNERAMRRSLAERMARIGGVLGLGTGGDLNGDPLGNWVNWYRDALTVMGNRGVALGTDINGYVAQIPSSSRPVSYPIDVGRRFFPDPSSSNLPPLLEKHRLGNRQPFDVGADGIAHYGMLPDFLQAVHEHMGNDLAGMFRSAEDVIEMWEKVETRSRFMRGTMVSLWVVNEQGDRVSYKEHGPFLGWIPVNYSGGRILWRGADGIASLWSVDEQGNQVGYKEHGPFPDWTPINYSDGRILWRHLDGRASLWVVDEQGNQVGYKEHGPFPDWTPINYSDGRILWRHSDGHASLWVVNEQGDRVSYKEHKPDSGWMPINYSGGKLLWHHISGRISLWTMDDQGNQVDWAEVGDFPTWMPLNYADGAILWRTSNGRVSLWRVNERGAQVSYKEHGPFPGWIPVCYSGGRILWMK